MNAPGTEYRLEHPEWRVPSFHVLELSEKRSRYCVCIPVINEGARIAKQLERTRPYAAGLDFLIADGGSTDGSLAESFLRTTVVRALLTKTGPGRLSAQMRMAIAWALEQGYEGVIFVDGNNKDDPSALPEFARLLDAGFDHVQGSRYVPGGRAIHTPFARHWGVKLLHGPLISFAARFPYTDTTNGFRAYSRRFLLDPRVQPLRDCFVGYELHYYLAIRAARLGFKVCETPVTREYPPKGSTPTKISPIRGNLKVLRTLFRSVFIGYDPEDSTP